MRWRTCTGIPGSLWKVLLDIFLGLAVGKGAFNGIKCWGFTDPRKQAAVVVYPPPPPWDCIAGSRMPVHHLEQGGDGCPATGQTPTLQGAHHIIKVYQPTDLYMAAATPSSCDGL